MSQENRSVASAEAQPALPRSAWRSLEPVFTTVLTLSFLGHALFMLTVFEIEPPPPPSLQDVAALIERLRPPPPVIPPPPAPDVEPARAPPEPKETTGPKKVAPSRRAVAQADRDEVRRQVARSGLIARIGTAGGAVADVFASRSVLGGLSTDLRGLSGVRTKGNSHIDGPRGGDPTGPADITLTPGATKPVGFGKKQKAKLKPPPVKEGETKLVDRDVNKKALLRVLRNRRGAFQHCYEQAIKTERGLKGKLVVEFVIDRSGRVVSADVVRDRMSAPVINRCVTRAFTRLRFGQQSSEVTVTHALVFQPMP